jgi:hypothetical protein
MHMYAPESGQVQSYSQMHRRSQTIAQVDHRYAQVRTRIRPGPVIFTDAQAVADNRPGPAIFKDAQAFADNRPGGSQRCTGMNQKPARSSEIHGYTGVRRQSAKSRRTQRCTCMHQNPAKSSHTHRCTGVRRQSARWITVSHMYAPEPGQAR